MRLARGATPAAGVSSGRANHYTTSTLPDIHAQFHNQPFIMRRAIWRHVFGHTVSLTHTLTHTIKPPTAGV